MRPLLYWLDTVLVAQPFYTDEIAAVRMMAQTFRHSLPRFERRPPN